MTGQGSSRTDSASQEALRQRCLALVRRWQPLSHGGWDRGAARQLAEEVDQVADTSERLGLDRLNGDALDLAAYLSSFIDDALTPGARDLQRLAGMVNALGRDLTELSATETATVRTLPSARPSADTTTKAEGFPAGDDTAEPVLISGLTDLPNETVPEPAREIDPVPDRSVDAFFAALSSNLRGSRRDAPESASQPPTPAAEIPAAEAPSPPQPKIPDGESAAPVVAAGEAPTEPNAAVRPAPLLRLPRAVAMFGIDDSLAPGLGSALVERGYEARSLDTPEALLRFATQTVPGVLLFDARRLRLVARVRGLFEAHGVLPEEQPSLLVISPDGDLGQRLLAMRAGAVAFFSAPLDSLRVLAKLDELLAHTATPAWRVLLADADREHALDAARSLAERGMTARIVSNAQAALAALAEFRPDVIVVDHDLADVRGIELTQMIRQQPEQAAVPIIVAAAPTDANLRFDAIAAGGDEFLVKPVKSRHLLAAVNSRLRRANWLREVIGNPDGRDSRTGLYSRSLLIDRLSNALGDRSAALLTIAIDRSSELRERIGLAGLSALDAHVGNLLRSQLDELDLPAQYQDFHYFVLLHRRSRADITAAAERIRFALAGQVWLHNGVAHSLSASIGMALLGGEHPSVDAVVTNAEAARVAASHLGGNRVLSFEAKEAALLPPDPALAMRAVLSRPLTPEQTLFEFQPIVPLAGKLQGQFELGFKVRSVQHPGMAMAYAELAPVAAECGQLIQLDRWILEHALKVREEQLKRGRQLRLFVPQSVDSLLDPDLAFWLTREMKDRHLSGTGLTLEFPCTPLIDAGPRAAERLKYLHGNGIRVCLNEFGRDWAAVHALRNLTVDFVRLSPALVEELGSTQSSVSDTLLALVRKAHAVGTAVIGPGTDAMNRAHHLLRLGVDYGVGSAFCKPLSTPEFDFSRPLW